MPTVQESYAHCWLIYELWVSQIADPGVASSIPARSHTFGDYREIFSTVFHGYASPSADSRMVVVSYKRKYVHDLLFNRLVKLAQEKA